jgi:hypothetical protein
MPWDQQLRAMQTAIMMGNVFIFNLLVVGWNYLVKTSKPRALMVTVAPGGNKKAGSAIINPAKKSSIMSAHPCMSFFLKAAAF